MASADLLWECVKDHSSFIRKVPNAPVMSAEPGNIYSLNCMKYSALASKQVVDVTVKTVGKKQTITLMKKGSDKLRRPSRQLVGTGLKRATKKAVAAITNKTEKIFYRPDLKEAAVKKYMKIKESFRKNKAIPTKKIKTKK